MPFFKYPNLIVTSEIGKRKINTDCKKLYKEGFSWKYRVRLLFSDLPTDRVSTDNHQRLQRLAAHKCCHNSTQQHNDFATWRERNEAYNSGGWKRCCFCPEYEASVIFACVQKTAVEYLIHTHSAINIFLFILTSVLFWNVYLSDKCYTYSSWRKVSVIFAQF